MCHENLLGERRNKRKKCEWKFDPYSSSYIKMWKTSFVWLINVTLCSFLWTTSSEPELTSHTSWAVRMIIRIKRPYKEAMGRESFYALSVGCTKNEIDHKKNYCKFTIFMFHVVKNVKSRRVRVLFECKRVESR